MRFKHPITLQQLLDIIQEDVVIRGNPDKMITGINEYHSVEAGDLSFVDHPKYYEKVINSAAGTILIDKETDFPEGKTLLISKDPLAAYVKVVKHFTTFNPQETSIHPTAVIGKNTIIQPHTFIGENVKIGDNCVIHSNVTIYADTTIGNNVILHATCVLGADAFYFQRRPEGWFKLISCGRTIIGNHVEIGSGVTIDRGVSGDTTIGDGTIFDNQVQVGHDTFIGKRCLIGAHSSIAGCTYIDDDCIIWAKASVNKDLYVAKNTTLLALSAIDKSVTEEGTVLFGVPAYDARKKWKEMACSRMLPDLVDEFKLLQKEVEELKKKL